MAGQEKLDFSKGPLLPYAPVQYDRTYNDTFNNILRQYFNTLDNINASLLGPSGGKYLSNPNGSFISTSTQTAAATGTAYAITLSGLNGTTDNNVFIGSQTANVFPSSKIYVEAVGIYNLQFSLQLENSDTQIHDVDIWLRKNGANEANSNTLLSVPNKHGGVNGHTVAAWNFYLEYTALTDYFELCWAVTNTAISIPNYAAASPAPATPSVILTMHYVSRL